MIDLIGITPIEKAFYDKAKTNPKLQEYFFTYYSQKLVLLNHFYPHIEGTLRGFPDHGPDHVIRIMELYGKMLKNNIVGLSASEEIVSAAALNFYEIYLLLCGTIWHDVGNILGRNQHNKHIIEISNRLKDHFFLNKDLKKYALQIAEAHTGADGVRQKIPVVDIAHKNEEINLHFMGAILRFGDELEEGGVRVDRAYYEHMKDKIPDNKRIYWETGCCINRIEPNPDEFTIEIRTKIDKNKLCELFPKNGKPVALIDELVSRIDKINRERMYYMQFVRKHIEYRQIVFDLTVENSKPEQLTFRFTDDRGYDDFWRNFPQINPENHLRGYTLRSEVKE